MAFSHDLEATRLIAAESRTHNLNRFNLYPDSTFWFCSIKGVVPAARGDADNFTLRH
ncbi:MAG: hypothetical protein P8X85_13980 [Desulfobacterales bacterium]